MRSQVMSALRKNRFMAAWHAWTRPRATGREQAFRERVLRAVVVIIVAISMSNVAGLLLSPDHPDSRALTWVVYSALAIFAGILIVRKHITSTTILISIIALLALGVSEDQTRLLERVRLCCNRDRPGNQWPDRITQVHHSFCCRDDP